MDRGAWWATVHGVTRSQTWPSDGTTTMADLVDQDILFNLSSPEEEQWILANIENWKKYFSSQSIHLVVSWDLFDDYKQKNKHSFIFSISKKGTGITHTTFSVTTSLKSYLNRVLSPHHSGIKTQFSSYAHSVNAFRDCLKNVMCVADTVTFISFKNRFLTLSQKYIHVNESDVKTDEKSQDF